MMQEVLRVGNLEVKPGAVGKGSLGSIGLAACRVDIPVMAINGVEEGPTVVVLAGVHGTELSGIGALLRGLREVKPQEMKGRVIAVTGANPLAIQVGAYTTPIDGENLSSSFLENSDPQGSTTKRMGALISPVVEMADYLVDMHANPLPSIPFVLMNTQAARDERTLAGMRLLAEAFGTTIIDYPRPPRSMRDRCSAAGVPGVTPELPGNIYLWDDINEIGAIGVTNILKALKMIPGEPRKQTVAKIEGDLRFHGFLRTDTGGLVYYTKAPGTRIQKGEEVAQVLDFYGDVRQSVRMPITGYCWSFLGGVGGSHAVTEGDQIAYMFYDLNDKQ